MAISFVAANTGTADYVASIVINKPTGTIDGDVLVAVVGGTRSGAPTGWTLLGSAASGTVSLGTVYCYYKVASGEGSSYTFSFTGSFEACGVIAAYRGVNNTTPVDTTHFSVNAVASGTTAFNTTSVTAAATQWGVTFATAYEFGSSSARTWTEGSGTERTDVSVTDAASPDNCNLELTDSNANLVAGAFTRTQTRSATSSGGVSGVLLLNAAVTGTSAPAGSAAVTVTAYNPTVSRAISANPEQPPVDVTAQDTTVKVGAVAEACSVGATAYDATIAYDILAPAGQTAVGATAQSATVPIGSSAEQPDVAATAYDTTASLGVAAETIITAAAAQDAPLADAPAGLPAITTTAYDAVTPIIFSVEQPDVTVTAYDATVSFGATAGSATTTATAQGAPLASVSAGLAAVTTTAYDAVVALGIILAEQPAVAVAVDDVTVAFGVAAGSPAVTATAYAPVPETAFSADDPGLGTDTEALTLLADDSGSAAEDVVDIQVAGDTDPVAAPDDSTTDASFADSDPAAAAVDDQLVATALTGSDSASSLDDSGPFTIILATDDDTAGAVEGVSSFGIIAGTQAVSAVEASDIVEHLTKTSADTILAAEQDAQISTSDGDVAHLRSRH